MNKRLEEVKLLLRMAAQCKPLLEWPVVEKAIPELLEELERMQKGMSV